MIKNLPANAGAAGATGSIPGWGRFPGGGNGNPLWCPCMGYGSWGHKESDSI